MVTSPRPSEHAEKFRRKESEIAQINAGGRTAERLTRRRKTMENESGGGERGHHHSYPQMDGLIGIGRWRR